MRFKVTLTTNVDHAMTIDAESVSYKDAPGFVMFKDAEGEAVMTFNASKVESVKTIKELKQ
jgi:hypothetical protein